VTVAVSLSETVFAPLWAVQVALLVTVPTTEACSMYE
jgi:hypothetical protein